MTGFEDYERPTRNGYTAPKPTPIAGRWVALGFVIGLVFGAFGAVLTKLLMGWV